MKFKEIIKNSEKKYLYLLLSLCFLHALHGFIYSCLPFIFYDPSLTCYSNVNGTTISFPCDQNFACEKNQYEINYETSFRSITTEFELICSKRFQKPTMQTSILAGTTISGLSMSFIKVNPFKRIYLIIICYFFGGLAAIISSLLNDIVGVAITLFICYLFSYVWYANIYTYASETFPSPLKKIVPSLLTSSYGMGTMIYSLLTLGVDNWRHQMAFYYGIPVLFFIILLSILNKRNKYEPINIENEKQLNEVNEVNEVSTKSYGLFGICKEKHLCMNAFVYIFLWIMNSISYSGCDIALGSLSGKLAFTMFFLGAVQSFCSLISGVLVLKFNEETLLKYTTIFMAFFFALYIFEPQNKINPEIWVSVLFTLFMVLANIGIELNWTILVNLLQKYIPLDYQQNVFAFGDMLSMVITLILPYYIEIMIFISTSPIFGFGILALLGRVCLTCLKKKKDEFAPSEQTNKVEMEIHKENNYHLIEK